MVVLISDEIRNAFESVIENLDMYKTESFCSSEFETCAYDLADAVNELDKALHEESAEMRSRIIAKLVDDYYRKGN